VTDFFFIETEPRFSLKSRDKYYNFAPIAHSEKTLKCFNEKGILMCAHMRTKNMSKIKNNSQAIINCNDAYLDFNLVLGVETHFIV